jgi:hypothetical protein
MTDTLMTQITQEMQNAQWSQAEQDLNTGLKDHPHSAKGWYLLSQTEIHLNHPDLANTDLQNALKYDTKHELNPAFVEQMNQYIAKEKTVQTNHTAQPYVTSQNVSSVHPAETFTHSSTPIGAYLMIALLGAIAVACFMAIFRRKSSDTYVNIHTAGGSSGGYQGQGSIPPVSRPSSSVGGSMGGQSQPYYQSAPSPQTVYNGGSSGGGHSTGALLGGIAAGAVGGMLLDEALRDHNGGYYNNGMGGFGNNGNSEIIEENNTFINNGSNEDVVPPDSFVDTVNNDGGWDDNSSQDDSSNYDDSSSYDDSNSGGGDDSGW